MFSLLVSTALLDNSVGLQVLAGTSSESQTESTQVPAAFRNFSMSQKEKTIEELVRDQWLCSISDGKIGLGMRSFLDLRSWFRSNEVPTCEVCNEAAVKVYPHICDCLYIIITSYGLYLSHAPNHNPSLR